ncbi:MAG: hypothetical protein B6D54_05645 [Epsilonproteobacteria bacterium 4484_65]|nr:MAG: hypothetical protein B6D54_05645 [Epsilonproteobacteria bacterium 4484_65]
MDELLKEIQELKTEQMAFNNLLFESGKQNEMIFVVLKELLAELREGKSSGELEEILGGILEGLEVLNKTILDSF